MGSRRLRELAAITFLLAALVMLMPAPVTTQSVPIAGFADLHNHQFANLAYGGNMVVGHAYHDPDQALSAADDRFKHGQQHSADILGCMIAADAPCVPFGPIFSGWNYPNSGYPTFVGWPNFIEVSHQKVYRDWLFRAVEGGLRLMVMMAVDGPPLCNKSNNDGRNCDDEMETIDLQIQAAKDMQEYLDLIDLRAGGPGKGWYQIVTTPSEAREVMAQGKLAVVLGIETAHLFNCKKDGPCNWMVDVQKYWDQGVRHFFPLHQDNNRFGGASYFNGTIQKRENWFADDLKPWLWGDPYTMFVHPCEYDSWHCNNLGLTEEGQRLVRQLMRLGAVIDVDHMSDRTFDGTLSLAEQYGYPVVAGHTGFNEIGNGAQDHEGLLRPDELERIQRVGGIVGLFPGQRHLEDIDTYSRSGYIIPHVCGRSTETFAQNLLYAVDHAPGMAVAIGSDMNGMAAMPGPRFGGNECYGGRDSSRPKVQKRLPYPFIASATGRSMPKHVFFGRTDDYNIRGLAHVGLLPDFFADLEVLGVQPAELRPLFTSAEGYVKVWERALHSAGSIPPERPEWNQWQHLDGNPATVAIAVDQSTGQLYQRHRTGSIWRYTGVPHTGWEELDNNPATTAIAAGDGQLYQLHNSGRIWRYTGVRYTGWQEIDNNPLTVSIAVGGGKLYQLHSTGSIWRYTGTPMTGWQELDNNPETGAIEVDANTGQLYQLHRSGRIWRYTGTPLIGWQEIDNNPETRTITASGGRLYQLHANGVIWRYTGTPFTGWEPLDNNAQTKAIVASGLELYQLHHSGAIWRYTGTPFVGWQQLDGNPASVHIAAGLGQLYQLHSSGAIWRYSGS